MALSVEVSVEVSEEVSAEVVVGTRETVAMSISSRAPGRERRWVQRP